MNKSEEQTTLADIAAQAGVSAATVSAVLHASKGNNSRFSAETALKVKKAAGKLGYRANRMFRNFNRKRHGSIGIVHMPGGFISEFTLLSMSETAAEYDQLMVYSHITGGNPIFMKEDAVDGLVIFGESDGIIADRAQKLKIPTLYVNCNKRGEPGTVTFGERDAMIETTEHLCGRGYRNIIYILTRKQPDTTRHYSIGERWNGIKEGCSIAGLAPPAKYELENPLVTDVAESTENYETVIQELLQLFRERPETDAVILDFRLVNAHVYEAARRLDLSIPGDLGVVAINPFHTADHMYPPVTTIGPDFSELGRIIVRELNKCIENGSESVAPVVFPMNFHPRNSTRRNHIQKEDT